MRQWRSSQTVVGPFDLLFEGHRTAFLPTPLAPAHLAYPAHPPTGPFPADEKPGALRAPVVPLSLAKKKCAIVSEAPKKGNFQNLSERPNVTCLARRVTAAQF